MADFRLDMVRTRPGSDSGLIQAGVQARADRFTYIPQIGSVGDDGVDGWRNFFQSDLLQPRLQQLLFYMTARSWAPGSNLAE